MKASACSYCKYGVIPNFRSMNEALVQGKSVKSHPAVLNEEVKNLMQISSTTR